jgi:hypothetical protein
VASKSEQHQPPASLFVTVLPVADGQLVGQAVAAVVTGLATVGAAAWAAFAGARTANRSTEVEDKRAREIAAAEDRRTKEIAAAEAQRAKEAAEWDRLHRMVTMAFSTNETEAFVGMDLLEKSMADWNDNPEQRKFIKNVLAAMTAGPVQAFSGSQTPVVTSASPLQSVPPAPVGTS